jgi:hypothetical protein
LQCICAWRRASCVEDRAEGAVPSFPCILVIAISIFISQLFVLYFGVSLYVFGRFCDVRGERAVSPGR